MRDQIESRFERNLERVTHLVSLYDELTAPAPGASPRRGRTDVETSDLLRAAVVFLHATNEDLLRSLLGWKLPKAGAAHLEDVPLPGKKARSSFKLNDLAAHRGSTVDDVIAQAVEAHLERSSFNDPGEVKVALVTCGLDDALVKPYAGKLGAMMKRRHWIVHRADQNQSRGPGHQVAQSLQRATVRAWHEAVERFGRAVLAVL